MKCLSNELQFGELEEAVKSADTYEEINNGPATAPSVRLMKAIAGYNKVLYGACLVLEIEMCIRDRPKVPADLGYYDLRLPEVREAQAQLAQEAGIGGLCHARWKSRYAVWSLPGIYDAVEQNSRRNRNFVRL